MNIKITNCLRDLKEMEEKISQASVLESELAETGDEFSKKKKADAFKILTNEIKFLQQNILRSLPFAKVEEKADVDAIKECINKVLNAKYGEIKQEDKVQITKTLNEITDEQQMKEISDFTTSLIAQDDEFIKDMRGGKDVVIRALRAASVTGQPNAIVDYTFGEFYNIQDFLINNMEEMDLGKNVVNTICKDPQIAKEYKSALKNAYLNLVAVEKYNGLSRGGVAALKATLILSIPLVPVAIAEMIGTGIIKGAGKLVNKVTEVAALPFDLAALKIVEKGEGSTASKVGATIVDAPGIVLKAVGYGTEKLTKGLAKVVDYACKIALLPVSLGISGILKAGKVDINDRIKDCDKKIRKSVAKVLSGEVEGVKVKDIVAHDLVLDENSLTVFGYNDVIEEPFSVSYKISKNVFESIKKLRAAQLEINENLLKAELVMAVTGDKSLAEEVQKLQIAGKEAMFSEALMISNIITNQKPLEVKLGNDVELPDKPDYMNDLDKMTQQDYLDEEQENLNNSDDEQEF